MALALAPRTRSAPCFLLCTHVLTAPPLLLIFFSLSSPTPAPLRAAPYTTPRVPCLTSSAPPTLQPQPASQRVECGAQNRHITCPPSTPDPIQQASDVLDRPPPAPATPLAPEGSGLWPLAKCLACLARGSGCSWLPGCVGTVQHATCTTHHHRSSCAP